jgi:hypothetical protein
VINPAWAGEIPADVMAEVDATAHAIKSGEKGVELNLQEAKSD